ncbi:DUF5825 family protein [Inquilinus sp. CA228]|uniref:DUF5825 family protein n=1 Tax=Inquilinus sp. CA228 TaxID=3455609 RepID=UPI003F8D7D1B
MQQVTTASNSLRLHGRSEISVSDPGADEMFADLGRIEALARAGMRRVSIRDPVDLGLANERSARAGLCWLRAIRDLAACGIDVDWTIRGLRPDLVPALRHLAPPSAGDLPEEQLFDWRRDFCHGRCYWRKGTDFVIVRDSRFGRFEDHYVLNDHGSHQVFLAAVDVCREADLERIDPKAKAALDDERLLLSAKGWSVALPHRMKYWPVQFGAAS